MSHWYVSGSRAVTAPSDADLCVSACFTWCGSRLRVSFSETIEAQARYFRAASSSSCRRVLSAARNTSVLR